MPCDSSIRSQIDLDIVLELEESAEFRFIWEHFLIQFYDSENTRCEFLRLFDSARGYSSMSSMVRFTMYST